MWGVKNLRGVDTMEDIMMMNRIIFHNTRQYNKYRNKVNPYKSNVPNDIETGQLVCDTIEWVLYDWKHWFEVC